MCVWGGGGCVYVRACAHVHAVIPMMIPGGSGHHPLIQADVRVSSFILAQISNSSPVSAATVQYGHTQQC